MTGTVFCPIFEPARESAPALELAADLADRSVAPLAVVGVTAPIPPMAAAPGIHPGPAMTPVDIEIRGPAAASELPAGRASVAELEELLDAAGIEATYVDAVVGVPVDVVRELADRDDAAFVVAHDTGAGPLRSKLTGNPGREVVRDAGCPIVLTPDGTGGPLTPRPRILCAVDDDDMALPVLSCAGALAADLGASIHVVFARRDETLTPIVSEGLLVRSFDQLPSRVEASFMTIDEPAAQSIDHTARQLGADLIAIGRPHRGAVGSALRGSVAHEVVERGAAPVVVVPDLVPDA